MILKFCYCLCPAFDHVGICTGEYEVDLIFRGIRIPMCQACHNAIKTAKISKQNGNMGHFILESTNLPKIWVESHKSALPRFLPRFWYLRFCAILQEFRAIFFAKKKRPESPLGKWT